MDNVASVHVVAGDSVVLQCVVVLPPLETSYEIGWLNVSGGELVSEYSAGNDMFRISEALEEDAGEYRCILRTQTSGTEDADIELVVISKYCRYNEWLVCGGGLQPFLCKHYTCRFVNCTFKIQN